MMDPNLVDLFYKYLNINNPKDPKNWEDLGLVQEAPIEAVAAYIKFQKIMRKAEKDDIDL